MEVEEVPQLICRMRWTDDIEAGTGDRVGTLKSTLFTMDWVKGDDRGLFESFTNHVWKKVETELAD